MLLEIPVVKCIGVPWRVGESPPAHISITPSPPQNIPSLLQPPQKGTVSLSLTAWEGNTFPFSPALGERECSL